MLGLDKSVSAAKEILEVEKNRLRELGEAGKAHYHRFPPSNAVDGRFETAFRSPENAKKDDWIVLSLTRAVLAECLVLDVGEPTEIILREAIFELSQDGLTWKIWTAHLNCTTRVAGSQLTGKLCRTEVSQVYARYFRVRLVQDVEETWVINEMYIEQ